MKKKIKGLFFIIPSLILIFVLLIFYRSLYQRTPMDFTFDAAYWWAKSSEIGIWQYEEVPAGFHYFLYIPEKFKNDKDNPYAELPLIVTFHGSTEKGLAPKYGRIFTDKKFQSRAGKNGAAVLSIMSRADYFTDPEGTSLLIQNICLKNECIDRTNIVAYGFSQGAEFAVELACHEKRLFRAVVSGSGFYNITKKELIKVLPIQFYFATSKNDKGIYEQGSSSGKLCERFCKNSRYVEYEKRGHFYVELNDRTGKKNKDGSDETFLDWICTVVNSDF
jgi:predicted peptidase